MLSNGARLGSMLDWLARCLCLLKGDSFALHAAGDLGYLGGELQTSLVRTVSLLNSSIKSRILSWLLTFKATRPCEGC